MRHRPAVRHLGCETVLRIRRGRARPQDRKPADFSGNTFISYKLLYSSLISQIIFKESLEFSEVQKGFVVIY